MKQKKPSHAAIATKKANATATILANKAQIITEKILQFLGSKKFLYIILAWFVLQAGFMAITTAKGIAPDEGTHFRSIQVFTENGFDPFFEQGEGTYSLGVLARTPNYMFYYLMSFVYRVIPSGWSQDAQLITLRLVNMLFTLGGLVVLWQTLKLLTKRGIIQNLTVFMMTNTLMFVFLAGALSYDNLFFLASNIALYYFVKLLIKFSVRDTLKLGAAVVFALLSKFTFVPLAVAIAGLLIFRYARDYKKVWTTAKTEVGKYQKPVIILSAVFLVFVGLFMERYLVNYIRYGSYRPKCEKVLTVDQCMQSALYRRNKAFQSNPVKDPTPDPDFVVRWAFRTKETVFGIMGHRAIKETPFIKYGTAMLFIFMLIALTRTITLKDKLVLYLLVVIVMYVGVLIVHNHNLYQRSGLFGLALQGRYIFPVLGLMYFVGNYFVDKLLRRHNAAYLAYAAIAIGIFFVGSLPTYVYVLDASWRIAAMQGFTQNLQQIMRLIIP